MSILRKFAVITVLITGVCLFPAGCIFGQEQEEEAEVVQAEDEEPEFAGEMFGVPVPAQNYKFIMWAALRFGSPWAGIPNNKKALAGRVWDELIMSYEAFQRGIEVSQEELEEEIEKTIKGKQGDFDWKTDREAYEKWVQENLYEPVELFENQLRHLVQLRKLYNEIQESAEVTITDEEAHTEYFNEANTLSVQLVQFDELKDAEEFYKKATEDKKFWGEEVEIEEKAIEQEIAEGKEKRKSKFKKPGFVSTEFLMHMWKFPKDDCYKMMEAEIGSLYPPTPIYKGYGVFKILKQRPAIEEEFPKKKDYYVHQLTQTMKRRSFFDWLRQKRVEAEVKKRMYPPADLFGKPLEEQAEEEKAEEKKSEGEKTEEKQSAEGKAEDKKQKEAQ
ncbi:hypothetical protein ACFL3N_00425 [Candidatus Omnitrophota bacterium]